MALKKKNKDVVPSFFRYGIFAPWLVGIQDDAPEWAKQEYAKYLRQKEKDKETMTKQ